ncbi:hypothetical protein YC2023_021677 [Brassica napus]
MSSIGKFTLSGDANSKKQRGVGADSFPGTNKSISKYGGSSGLSVDDPHSKKSKGDASVSYPGLSKSIGTTGDSTGVPTGVSNSKKPNGLDVNRTDRSLEFYEKNENLSKLWDILSVYAWIDQDVGYCQGMSDLCSPMIVLLEEEADSFFCFERLMRNFRSTGRSVGVEATHLSSITQIIDPKLHQHLGITTTTTSSLPLYISEDNSRFCDSLYLWEMMWALEYDPDLFHIYKAHQCGSEKVEVSTGKPKSMSQCGNVDFVKPEPNRQTSPCAGQRHQTSRSAGEPSRDTARELEPSHALEEDDGNGESNANTGVALDHSFTVKPAFSVGSNLKPSAARKELRCPLVSTRERFKWCWFHVGATTQVDISCCGFSHVLAMFVSENNKDSQEISEKG